MPKIRNHALRNKRTSIAGHVIDFDPLGHADVPQEAADYVRGIPGFEQVGDTPVQDGPVLTAAPVAPETPVVEETEKKGKGGKKKSAETPVETATGE